MPCIWKYFPLTIFLPFQTLVGSLRITSVDCRLAWCRAPDGTRSATEVAVGSSEDLCDATCVVLQNVKSMKTAMGGGIGDMDSTEVIKAWNHGLYKSSGNMASWTKSTPSDL